MANLTTQTKIEISSIILKIHSNDHSSAKSIGAVQQQITITPLMEENDIWKQLGHSKSRFTSKKVIKPIPEGHRPCWYQLKIFLSHGLWYYKYQWYNKKPYNRP